MQRYAGIQNILDDQQVAAVDRLCDILDDLHLARGLGALAVAGYDHKIHVARRINGAGQVGHEHIGALEHTDDQRVLVAVVLRDTRTQLCYLFVKLLLGKVNFLDVISHIISHFSITPLL